MSAKYHLTFSALEIRTIREALENYPDLKESYPEFYTDDQCVKSKEISFDFVYCKMLWILIDCYFDFLVDQIDSCDKGNIPYSQIKHIFDTMLISSGIADKISAALG